MEARQICDLKDGKMDGWMERMDGLLDGWMG